MSSKLRSKMKNFLFQMNKVISTQIRLDIRGLEKLPEK